MFDVNKAIYACDDVICRNIESFTTEQRGLLSQNILSQLRNNVLGHFLASVCNGKETVGVCLSCQLVKIGTFTNQLTDDVDMLLRDSFTYRTVLDE